MSTLVQTSHAREQWLAARRLSVGASEAAAILNLSPWATPLSVYLEKTGVPRKESNASYLAWGLRFQPVIAQIYADESGRELVTPPDLVRHPEWSFMHASMDYLTRTGQHLRPLEIKRVSPYYAKSWGPSQSADVPIYVNLQVQQQMACGDYGEADVAAFIGWDDLRCYTIQRDDAVISKLAEAEQEFMDRVDRQDPPLPDFEHPTTAQLLAMIEPNEGMVMPLPDEVLDQVDVYEALGKEIELLKKQREAAQSRLVHAMGTAEKATLPDGRNITRKIVHRAGYSVDPSTYTMFRVNQPRSRK